LRIRILRILKVPKIHEIFTNFKIANSDYHIHRRQFPTNSLSHSQTQHLTLGLKVP